MEPDKVIYIRTDGNSKLATGHLMRCLTIARALTRMNENVMTAFLVSDEESAGLLRSFFSREEALTDAFQIVVLNTPYDDLDQELPLLLPFLGLHQVDWMLVDSYYVTPLYLAAARQLTRIAYLDDIQAFDYPADLVINYDITASCDFYKSAGSCLLGGSYAPLREQFLHTGFQVYQTVKNILLTTGGTDPCDVAGTFLTSCTADGFFANAGCFLHCVVGGLYPHKEALAALAVKYPSIILHENVEDMASLMAECDLAISAGGTTLYELCAVGVPSVSYAMADNQLPSVQAFALQNVIPYAGDVRNDRNFYPSLLSQVKKLAEDYPARKEYSLKMRAFIDGGGAMRIAQALLS